MPTSPALQRNQANDSSSGSRIRDWNRNNEPGSAFSGTSRGKRGGGRGGGRVTRGRGGRASGPSRGHVEPSQAPSAPSELPTSNHPPATLPQIEVTSEATSGSKVPSRRPSTRPISSASVPSTTPATQAPPAPKSTRPPNRRRRSNTQTKSSVPKLNVPPPLDQAALRSSQKGRTPSLQPPHSAPVSKDTPPHLTTPTPFDMRTDIDALVERVRAVAMSDHRPLTPGSHIDWAGDEDDSLPDLDDWGVKTASTTAAKQDAISPIMVEGLKSLPEPCKPPSPLGRDVASPMLPTILPDQPENTSKEPQKSIADGSVGEKSAGSQAVPMSADKKTEKRNAVPDIKVAGRGASLQSKGRPDVPKSAPLHPSLPPKPAFIDAPIVKKAHAGATPMRNTAPPRFPHAHKAGAPAKPVENVRNIPAAKPVEAATKPAETSPENLTDPAPSEYAEVPTPKVSLPAPSVYSKTKSALPVSSEHSTPNSEKPSEVKPIKVEDVTSEDRKDPEADDELHGGLQASMHAPKSLSDPSLPASNVAKQSTPNGYLGSHFTHIRAHTVGRPSSFTHNSPANASCRSSRSGPATPRGGFSQHARTHSSPPAGTVLNTHRAVHATRPVLTGDAISRLARTIGGASISSSPSKTTVSVASKD